MTVTTPRPKIVLRVHVSLSEHQVFGGPKLFNASIDMTWLGGMMTFAESPAVLACPLREIHARVRARLIEIAREFAMDEEQVTSALPTN